MKLNGLYVGSSRKPFEKAVELSTELNIVHVERRAKKLVTYLDPDELKTTWVGNKGIYRTRMAVADGGDLIILAPGVKAFGENEEMDKIWRTVLLNQFHDILPGSSIAEVYEVTKKEYAEIESRLAEMIAEKLNLLMDGGQDKISVLNT